MKIKKWKAAFLVCILALLFVPREAYAKETPTIIYNGQKKTFDLKNISENDLFKELKGLMPGDSVEQQIIIQTKDLTKETSLFLEADCKDEQELLKDMQFSVKQDGREISQSAVSFNQIRLGQFKGNSTVKVTVTLEVPVTVGNEIAEKEYNTEWTVIAQEDGKDINSKPIKTGDDFPIAMSMGILVLCAATIVYVLKRKNHHNP